MKAQTFILTVLFFLLTISSHHGNSTAALSNAGQTNNELTKTSTIRGDYTYERVFKDGIWWIYVYDNGVLVAVYPE